MAGVTISYKGSQIASMTSAGTKTLTTSGQYCEDNITVGYSAPSLESVTINAGNLLSQNTTFNSSNLVLYENNNFSINQNVSTNSSYKTWFDFFIPINLNEKIHLYMNLSLLCSDIDETITVDCDYTVTTSTNNLSFTSSSQNSNIKSFGVYYASNKLYFGFAKNNGSAEKVQITGQITITKVVDGIDTINLNLFDNPLYLNIYKSLAYRSMIASSAEGVSEWCNSLSSIRVQQFAGQPFSGNFTFNNAGVLDAYAFGSVYANTQTGTYSYWNINCPSCSKIDIGVFCNNRFLKEAYFSNCSIIGSYAFNNCAVSVLSFPLCTTISYNAFSQCGSLTTVSFPSCITIGANAFAYCSSLTTISFPSCTTISYNAFASCFSLTTASFPSCITIGSSAFYTCFSLTTISFPLCEIINPYAFAYCSSLTTASFPLCTTISYNAFAYCSSLTTASFPLCTTISYNAFSQCSHLTTISFPSCTTIGSSAFYGCYSLTTANFPSCEIIGTNAFYGCYSLTTANFPSCEIIGTNAFYSCSHLTTISFPSCTTIGSNAFTYCSHLTTISFPLCTSIQNNAFYNCSKLESIYFTGSSVPVFGTNIFYGTPLYLSSYLGHFGSIYVPSSLVNAYKTTTNLTPYSSRIVGI